MPAVIPFLAMVGATVAGLGQVATALVVLGSALTVGAYQRRKAKRQARDAYNDSLTDRLVMTATADGPRSRIYGRVRNVDGVLFKQTHGTDKRYYTLVVALCHGRSDAIEDIYFGDQKVAIDDDGFVVDEPFAKGKKESATANLIVAGGSGSVALPNTPLTGSVRVTYAPPSNHALTVAASKISITPTVVGNTVSVSGAPIDATWRVSYQWRRVRSYAKVFKYLGTDAQNIGADLEADFPDTILPTDRFAGITALRVRLEYSQDAFPNGIPPISAVVRGVRIAEISTPFDSWTENPALIAYDWATYPYGGGVDPQAIPTSRVLAAANACNVMNTFELDSGRTVEDRIYRCGIAIPLDGNPREYFDEIIESMAGKWAWQGGELHIVAGTYRAPVAIVDETWITDAGDIQIVAQRPTRELVNSYRAKYSDRDQAYAETPMPPVIAAQYVADDGQELVQELSMLGVTSSWHAQHVCSVMLREQREGLTCSLPCNMRGWPMQVFDTVYLDLPEFGFVGKTFEVLGYDFTLEGGVRLSLKETEAAIYDPDSGFADLGYSDNTALPSPWVVKDVEGLQAESGTEHLLVQIDGTVVSRVFVTWDPIEDAAVEESGYIEIAYGSPGLEESRWQTIRERGDAVSTYIDGVQDGSYLLIKARAANVLARGDWTLHLLHYVEGKTAAPPDVPFFSVIEQAQGGRIFNWTYPVPAPADLDGFQVRHNAGTTVLGWSLMAPLFQAASLERTKELFTPENGTYVFAIRAVDTSGNLSENARYVQATLDADPSTIVWSDITDRPRWFRAVSKGPADTQAPVAAGYYNGETNVGITFPSATTVFKFIKIRRSDGAVVQNSNATASGTSIGNLETWLDGTDAAHIAVLICGPATGSQILRTDATALAAALRCGASRGVLGSPQFKVGAAYILVGVGGCGEGNGFEAYSGSVNNDTNAWADVSFQVSAVGNLIVSGTTHKPRTLRDYSYTGDMNASADVTLIGTAGIEITGNNATRTAAGTGAWDQAVHSRERFAGGIFISFRAAADDRAIMAGINVDNSADSGYVSIDYALYLRNDGLIGIYESGDSQGTFGPYSPGDAFAILNDGSKLRYLHESSIIREVTLPAASRNLLFGFDASFFSGDGTLQNIRVGPLTRAAKNWNQSGDPGGNAIDGDTWYDPDTGKSWLRVNGAWQKVVGDLSVGTPEIADEAVTTAKFANLSATNAKIGNLAVSRGKIQNLAVDTLQIEDEAVITTRAAQSQTSVSPFSSGDRVILTAPNVTIPTDAPGTRVNIAWSMRGEIAPLSEMRTRIIRDPGGIVLYQRYYENPTNDPSLPDAPHIENISYQIQDAPGAGTWSYQMILRDVGNVVVTDRTLTVTGAKK